MEHEDEQLEEIVEDQHYFPVLKVKRMPDISSQL